MKQELGDKSIQPLVVIIRFGLYKSYNPKRIITFVSIQNK